MLNKTNYIRHALSFWLEEVEEDAGWDSSRIESILATIFRAGPNFIDIADIR